MILKETTTMDKVLSNRDAFNLLDIIHSSLSCTNEKEFIALIRDINRLIPFNFAACLMGKTSSENTVMRYELINISYPNEWLYYYVTKKYHLVDPIVKENFVSFSLQYWRDSYKKYNPPRKFLKEAEDFKLRKGYSIGQRNLAATEGSLFSFAGDDVEYTGRTEAILQRLAPHLHRAVNRLLSNDDKKARPISLTRREREILLWVKDGKSTLDISTILNISRYTVKFHMDNIFLKLNATSRTHAVAVALALKLIDL